jgi:hypothetical protein
MTEPTPTKPGFYWATIKNSNDWQPVLLLRSIRGLEVESICHYLRQPADRFTFGPEIIKPPCAQRER